MPTLAPSLSSPISHASLFTARKPSNHNIRDFLDRLNPNIPTIFDIVSNSAYYDHPDSYIKGYIAREHSQPLENMQKPFLWVERTLELHDAYGRTWQDMEKSEKIDAKDTPQKRERKGVLKKQYQNATNLLEKRFWQRIRTLKKRNMLEDTLVILTSDHGELLGERIFLRKRYKHGFPPCKELVKVPTLFFNSSLDVNFMRSIDIVPTAFGIMGKKHLESWDGVDVRKEKVKRGTNLSQSRGGFISYKTEWKWSEGEVVLTSNRLKLLLKILLMDFVMEANKFTYDRLSGLGEKLKAMKRNINYSVWQRKKQKEDLKAVIRDIREEINKYRDGKNRKGK